MVGGGALIPAEGGKETLSDKGFTVENVSKAAFKTFRSAGGECYAENKIGAFMDKCGVDWPKKWEQILKVGVVEAVAQEMFDVSYESVFWDELRFLERRNWKYSKQ